MIFRLTLGLGAALFMLGLAAWGPSDIGANLLKRSGLVTEASASLPVPELDDLVGGSAMAGAEEFRHRGFVLAKLRGLTTWWWKGGEERCIRTTTEQGLYRSLAAMPSEACFQ